MKINKSMWRWTKCRCVWIICGIKLLDCVTKSVVKGQELFESFFDYFVDFKYFVEFLRNIFKFN